MTYDAIVFFTKKLVNFVLNWIELLKFRDLCGKSDTVDKYLDNWTKIGRHVGIWLGNNCENYQLHRFTTSKHIAKILGKFIFSHTVESVLSRWVSDNNSYKQCMHDKTLSSSKMQRTNSLNTTPEHIVVENVCRSQTGNSWLGSVYNSIWLFVKFLDVTNGNQ